MESKFNKRESLVLAEIKNVGQQIFVEVVYAGKYSSGKAKLKACLSLEKRGLLKRISTDNSSSQVQRTNLFGHGGGSVTSSSLLMVFEVISLDF